MTFPISEAVKYNRRMKRLELLEIKLEAVRKWHKAQLGRQVDPTDIKELGEILEAEGK